MITFFGVLGGELFQAKIFSLKFGIISKSNLGKLGPFNCEGWPTKLVLFQPDIIGNP